MAGWRVSLLAKQTQNETACNDCVHHQQPMLGGRLTPAASQAARPRTMQRTPVTMGGKIGGKRRGHVTRACCGPSWHPTAGAAAGKGGVMQSCWCAEMNHQQPCCSHHSQCGRARALATETADWVSSAAAPALCCGSFSACDCRGGGTVLGCGEDVRSLDAL